MSESVKDRTGLDDNKKINEMSFSFFLGMVCVEEVQFLSFAKEVVERGSILGHKVFELKSVNFITLKVAESHRGPRVVEGDPERCGGES